MKNVETQINQEINRQALTIVNYLKLPSQPKLFFNIFGTAFAGKSTLTKQLKEIFQNLDINVGEIDGGDIIRRRKKTGKFTENGDLAPTDIFMTVVMPEAEKEIVNNQLIFSTGTGRTKEEAQILLNFAQKHCTLCLGFLLEISEEEAYCRLKKRQLQESRTDDNETALAHRIQVFSQILTEVKPVYPKMPKIDGERSIPDCTLDILEKISSQLNLLVLTNNNPA